MKLPAGKELLLPEYQKIQAITSKLKAYILTQATEFKVDTDDVIQIATIAGRAVEKALTLKRMSDIPGYVAPPVDPNAKKPGRPPKTK